MDKQEASEVLVRKLNQLRNSSYSGLVDLIKNPAIDEVQALSGTTYQIEVQAVWDDRKKGHLRVIVSVDDRGWRAIAPISDDFILAPDGSFVGE